MSIGLIRSVAASAGISPSSARRVARSAAHRYKVYTIPKKDGGSRTVAQPAREVKALQRSLISELEKSLPIHPAATAYRRGLSILDNAGEHKNAQYLLKLDFESFFPSIGQEALRSHLLKCAPEMFSEAEVSFILDLALWMGDGRRSLCIGAPSSPFLSNSVMFDFDDRVTQMCDAHQVVYTRYSDDIALSSRTPGVLDGIERGLGEIVRALEYPRLRLNDTKRRAVSRAAGMYVTGLTLANQGYVTVGRARKRGVRAGVQRYLNGMLDAAAIEKLRGELAFVLSIESSFREVLLRTYGPRALDLL